MEYELKSRGTVHAHWIGAETDEVMFMPHVIGDQSLRPPRCAEDLPSTEASTFNYTYICLSDHACDEQVL